MLESLHIQNYRLFKDLNIEKLARVNLIAGKNNCGKTALLETLRILGSEANKLIINDIVASRGDFELGNDFSYYSLFNNQINSNLSINSIKIKTGFYKPFTVSFDESHEKNIFRDYNSFVLEADILVNNPLVDGIIYLPLVFEGNNDAKFWDKISLTPKEEKVIEILKIIDNRIKIVRFDSGNVKVLLEGEDSPRLMKNLGEGVNRLFSIALALVNAQNQMLLIDEFEVGLHHSVQEQLWEIIFKYAQEWDIQVFVTTHSLDTVRSFSTILDKNPSVGQYMRLQKSRMTGEVEAVIYTKRSLDTAIEEQFETR